MNAITPARAFDLIPDRFDTFVASTFAASKAGRHVRDRLIAQVDGGRLDHMLLRARSGLTTLSHDVNRKAALNIIDFAFEPLVMQGMSTDQTIRYLGAVEKMLHVREARGLDGFGPLWVDTIHHVCVFSVLFQLAAFLGKTGRFGQVILLHQGQRPEPRLRIMVDLLRRAHGIALVLLQLQGRWFPRLAQLTTPSTAIFYLTDMPPEAFAQTVRKQRAGSRLLLSHDGAGAPLEVETVSGSQSFARRLGAARIVLDYPSTDSVRIRPVGSEEAATSLCPLEDWLFWPVLGSTAQKPAIAQGYSAQQ
ncbi:hypothetical protein [Bradyrhizobium sp. LHD-71]|uniref:hypothetical protein n=1 Tax=Bradyrhizobium sp. LHD-71 TaxID=3072141 RepID=UPI00280CC0CF|nr:hypothetical protein [Bradyrhizobium sp. LHD-71]MDQ8731887.1 hypothetical protein [Bradyrhizobium sp. LHD-71]